MTYTVIETRFAASAVRSLLWHGDTLLDYIGGAAYDLSGERRDLSTSWGHRFDSVTASPAGRFVTLYERLGTEGILLYEGEFVRTLSRSRYRASNYEYPVCLFTLPGGREVIAHCPDEYNVLQIEDALTGERLTASTAKSRDFFHSRLAANSQGMRLLSAGWTWALCDMVVFVDVMGAIREPHTLGTTCTHSIVSGTEVSGAAWLMENQAAVYSHHDAYDFLEDIEDAPTPRMLPDMLAVYDAKDRQYRSTVSPTPHMGTMYALDADHVLGLYDHPKIVRLSDGTIVQAWPHLRTGTQLSSIADTSAPPPPPMAFDAVGSRFAVADEEGITMLMFAASV